MGPWHRAMATPPAATGPAPPPTEAPLWGITTGSAGARIPPRGTRPTRVGAVASRTSRPPAATGCSTASGFRDRLDDAAGPLQAGQPVGNFRVAHQHLGRDPDDVAVEPAGSDQQSLLLRSLEQCRRLGRARGLAGPVLHQLHRLH